MNSDTDQRILTDLAVNGGGTYEAGTFLAFKPTSGYAVGIGGLRLPHAALPDLHPSRLLRMVSTEYATSFVGTWLESGTVYVDAVEYYGPDRRVDAILRGVQLGQAAIYDFASAESIDLIGDAL